MPDYGRVLMSEKTEKFLSMAAMCMRKVKLARDPLAKQQFEALARSWLQLAEQSGRAKSDVQFVVFKPSDDCE